MQTVRTLIALAVVASSLAACGSDEKTTVIHDRPVVVAPTAVAPANSPDAVEAKCNHGYDNASHSCY